MLRGQRLLRAGLIGVSLTIVSQPAWAQLTQITAVQIQPTPDGLNILLGGIQDQSSQITTSVTDRTLTIEISNAQLSLSEGPLFRRDNPAANITALRIEPLADNRVRITVVGQITLPGVTVTPDATGLLLAIAVTPPTVSSPSAPAPSAPAPTESTDNPENIEVVVTGQQEAGYVVEDATTATKFEAPLRDIPRSIQVVPEQVIEDQNAIRLDDALRNVSGVARDNTFGGTADGFLIRGFPADIFRDGLPEVSGTSVFFSIRETANLERIEVLKGPASILFGNVPPGGIINLVTKKPLADPFYAAAFTIGSFNQYRPTLDISGPLTPDRNLLYRLNAVYENSSSFRDFTQIERVFVAPVLAGKIGDRTALSFELEYLDDERPFDRGLVAIGDRPADIPISRRLGEPSDVRRVKDLSIGLRLEHEISDNWTLRNVFRGLFSDNFTRRFEPRFLDEETGILSREFRIVENDRQGYTFQTNIIGKFDTGPVKHQAVFGLDLSRVLSDEIGFRQRPTTPINIFDPVYGTPLPNPPLSFSFNSRTDNLGIYIQDLISLTNNLKLLVGGRFDLVDQASIDNLALTRTVQDDTAFSPTVGLVYQPIQPISLYASFSRSFQPNTAIAANGSFLEPEQGTQYEVGVKAELLGGRLSSTLAFYRLTESNVGVLDPINPDFFVPIGEQRSQGIELDVVGEILPGWNLIASYAYTNAEITQGDEFGPTGNRVPNVPFYSGSLWTTYIIQNGPAQGLGFGLGFFYVGDRAGDLENTFILPNYMRTDAAIYYRRKNWRLALNVKNLFNVRYFESSAFGRERITPGAPLTLSGTVSVEF